MNREQILDNLAQVLVDQRRVLVTAESCTGGGVASACTDMAGSSEWFDYGLVTYSNDAKRRFLQVPEAVLTANGAVSEETVIAMVAGAASGNQVALAVSGIAGPGGGSEEKPVGTVWFAWGNEHAQIAQKHLFFGNRSEVRLQAVDYALQGMLNWVESHPPVSK